MAAQELTPIQLSPHMLLHNRQVRGLMPMDRIDKLYEKWETEKVSPAPILYVFPTTFEIDATAQFAPGGAQTQGTAAYYSIAILPEHLISEYYPSICALGDWRSLFKRVDSTVNTKNHPLFYLDGDATVQHHFCNLLSRDLLALIIKEKHELAKQKADEERDGADKSDAATKGGAKSSKNRADAGKAKQGPRDIGVIASDE